MPDIFDRISPDTAQKEDIFDRIETASPGKGDIFDRIETPARTPMLERLGKGFGIGVAGAVKGMGGGMELVSKQLPEDMGIETKVWKDVLSFMGKQVAKLGKSREDFYRIKDPDFSYNLASGIGSMGMFLIPGLGATRAVQAAAMAPKLAALMGAGVSGTIESMTEAGSTYYQAKEKGWSEDQATSAANADFLLNLPLTVLLNRVGIFGDQATGILRGLKRVKAAGKAIGASGLSEGGQEGLQQLISNVTLKEDPKSGILESMIIGAITGSGFKSIEVASDILSAPQQTGYTPEQVESVLAELGGELVKIESAEDSMFGEESVWYNTPEGSTQRVSLREFSPEIVQQKMEDYRQRAAAVKPAEVQPAQEGDVFDRVSEPQPEQPAAPVSEDMRERINEKLTTIRQLEISIEDFQKKGNQAAVDLLQARLDRLRSSWTLQEIDLIENLSNRGQEAIEPSGEQYEASQDIYAEDIPFEGPASEIKAVPTIEMVKIANDLIGQNLSVKNLKPGLRGYFSPGQGSITLSTELFKRGNEQQLAATLSHEIGHLTDWLPEKSMKRGNIYGQLKSLEKYVKNSIEGSDLKVSELHASLYDLSKKWRPFDEQTASPGHLKYRKSSKEIYADFISVLFNNPKLAEESAPDAYRLFFEGLDKKLDVKQAYFDVQKLLNGTPQELLESRYQNIREMFAKGAELREQMRLQNELAKVNYWERIRQLVDDINRPVISKVQQQYGKGILPPPVSPQYELEEHSLVDNDVFLLISDLDKKVNSPLKEAGISEDDFGAYMFLKRVMGRPQMPRAADLQTLSEEMAPFSEEEQSFVDRYFNVPGRKDIANPLGFDSSTAAQQIRFLQEKLGLDTFNKMESIARDFHETIWPIVEEAVRVGSFNRETFENIIVPNKGFYVTFGVLNYLQEYVPATVKMQKGTLKQIENPVITTILKMVSLTRLNSRQRARNAFRDWMKTSYPGEITQVKRNFRGEFPSPAKGMDHIRVLEDGRLVVYEVDEYLAKSVNNTKDGDVLLIGHLINKVFKNQIFKNLYITYNPGFAFAFNPTRDFKRTYVNLNAIGQKASVLELLVYYVRSLPAAVRRQMGITDETVREMMETHALDVPFIDFNFNIHGDAYHGVLKQLGVLEGKEHLYHKMMKPLLRPFLQIMEGIRFSGSVLESLTKIAGYNVLKEKSSLGSQEIAFITRNYIGTPNYRRGGTVTSVTNSIFMFSNIFKEGLKSDMQLATYPKTRAGFWWSHFKINLAPKVLMFLAGAGYLGEELRRLFAGMSEYDKTNYLTVPLGTDENGKTIYLRIPHDETGRFMSAVLWKVLNGVHDKEPEKIQQILAFGAGQMPQVAPGIELSLGWAQYLTGKNPYDSFRGQYVISDQAWKAGGWPALKKMVQWTANNTGLLQFATYSDANQTTFESVVRTTPLINRLLKISDYGVTEKLREQRSDIQKKQAQTAIKKRELMSRGTERISRGENSRDVARDIAQKIYGRTTGEKVRLIEKNLREEQQRGSNVYIDMLMTASTNEEKDLILREMRQVYDAGTMRKLEREILRVKAASPSVIVKSRK